MVAPTGYKRCEIQQAFGKFRTHYLPQTSHGEREKHLTLCIECTQRYLFAASHFDISSIIAFFGV